MDENTIIEAGEMIQEKQEARIINNDENLVKIWEAVHKVMKYKNLTYRDVEEKSGIPYTMIYDGCKYHTNISVAALIKILDAFNLTLDEITCMGEIQLGKEDKAAKAKGILKNLMLSTPLVEKNYLIFIFALLPYMTESQLDALKAHILSYA